MNLLVDAYLSPAVAAELRDAGHDAVHVIDVGLATALDTEIVDYADANDLVIVTVDTDFPMLVALRRVTSPSVVLLRGVNELAPDEHAALSSRTCPPSPTTSNAAPSCPSDLTTSESEASHWPDRNARSAGDTLGHPFMTSGRRQTLKGRGPVLADTRSERRSSLDSRPDHRCGRGAVHGPA